MAIFKFRQIYNSICEVMGEQAAKELFSEYGKLPANMPRIEQVRLADKLMRRLDESCDPATVIEIRRRHPCNHNKVQREQILKTAERFESIEDRINGYSKYLSPGYSKIEDGVITVAFGQGRCVCPLLRGLDSYDPLPKTWCECCNAHVIMTFEKLCGTKIESEILQTHASGGNECLFRLRTV